MYSRNEINYLPLSLLQSDPFSSLSHFSENTYKYINIGAYFSFSNLALVSVHQLSSKIFSCVFITHYQASESCGKNFFLHPNAGLDFQSPDERKWSRSQNASVAAQIKTNMYFTFCRQVDQLSVSNPNLTQSS